MVLLIGIELLMFNADALTLKHPFSMILKGNRRTGKMQFIKRMLLERERFITPAIDHVNWIYTAPQLDVFKELQASMNNAIEFVHGLPENINSAHLEGKYGAKLVVLGDIMEDASARNAIKI